MAIVATHRMAEKLLLEMAGQRAERAAGIYDEAVGSPLRAAILPKVEMAKVESRKDELNALRRIEAELKASMLEAFDDGALIDDLAEHFTQCAAIGAASFTGTRSDPQIAQRDAD